MLSFIFKIKRVATHISYGSKKRMFKSLNLLKEKLTSAMDVALQQIKHQDYRARAPPGMRKIHEYGLAFAGKFCVVAVCTVQCKVDSGDWVEVNCGTAVVPNSIPEADLQVSGDDDMDVDK
jgi:hypothetical protein